MHRELRVRVTSEQEVLRILNLIRTDLYSTSEHGIVQLTGEDEPSSLCRSSNSVSTLGKKEASKKLEIRSYLMKSRIQIPKSGFSSLLLVWES